MLIFKRLMISVQIKYSHMKHFIPLYLVTYCFVFKNIMTWLILHQYTLVMYTSILISLTTFVSFSHRISLHFLLKLIMNLLRELFYYIYHLN